MTAKGAATMSYGQNAGPHAVTGTSDGRTVSVNGPYQYDIQPDGAMKAVFTRTITYPDGTARSDTFNSNYKSPGLYPTQSNPYL